MHREESCGNRKKGTQRGCKPEGPAIRTEGDQTLGSDTPPRELSSARGSREARKASLSQGQERVTQLNPRSAHAGKPLIQQAKLHFRISVINILREMQEDITAKERRGFITKLNSPHQPNAMMALAEEELSELENRVEDLSPPEPCYLTGQPQPCKLLNPGHSGCFESEMC